MGGAGAVVSLGMLALVPWFMDTNIETVGWRVTYRYMGALCMFFMAPFGWVFYRLKPEVYGLRADGVANSSTDAEEELALSAAAQDKSVDNGDNLRTTLNWEAEDALKTACFWAFAMAQLSQALTGTAFWFHLKEVSEPLVPSFGRIHTFSTDFLKNH